MADIYKKYLEDEVTTVEILERSTKESTNFHIPEEVKPKLLRVAEKERISFISYNKKVVDQQDRIQEVVWNQLTYQEIPTKLEPFIQNTTNFRRWLESLVMPVFPLSVDENLRIEDGNRRAFLAQVLDENVIVEKPLKVPVRKRGDSFLFQDTWNSIRSNQFDASLLQPETVIKQTHQNQVDQGTWSEFKQMLKQKGQFWKFEEYLNL